MMVRAGRRRRRLSGVLRLAAGLLLATIVSDLAADLNCDAVFLGAPNTVAVRASAEAGSDDSCGTFCVPDCFCCSRSLVAGSAFSAPEPAPLTSLDTPAKPRCPEGVRTVGDRPPLLRA